MTRQKDKKNESSFPVGKAKAIGQGIALRYELSGAGWATLSLNVNGQHDTYLVSYLHDSLTQLVEAAIGLLSQQWSEGLVVFMDEPGELQLSLKRQEDLLSITATWYTDWASWNMSSTHKELFTTTTTTRHFTTEVKKILDELYVKHGERGYKEQWDRADFPMRAYEKLAKLLKNEEVRR